MFQSRTQISCVGDGLHHIIRPGDAGMTYLEIPFRFCECGQRGCSRAQGGQLHQAATTDGSFRQAGKPDKRLLWRVAIVQ